MPRTGTVAWFNDDKGYGFRTLEKGQVVEFEFVDGSKGPRAEKVVIVGRALGGLT